MSRPNKPVNYLIIFLANKIFEKYDETNCNDYRYMHFKMTGIKVPGIFSCFE